MDWTAWDHSLETGNAAMDSEHRKLATLLEGLRKAAEHGSDKARCARPLDELIAHAEAHFALELRFMNEQRYPKLRQHVDEHAMLLCQARDYRANFDIESAAGRAALMRFPEVWLEFHILFSDKDLGQFLARGVGGRARR